MGRLYSIIYNIATSFCGGRTNWNARVKDSIRSRRADDFFFVAIVASLTHTCTGGRTVTDQLFRQRCNMCNSIAWNKRIKFSKCHEVGRGRWRFGVKKIFIHILYDVHSIGIYTLKRISICMFSISIYIVCKMYLKMRSFSYLVIMIRRIGPRVRVAFRQSCSSRNSSVGLVSAMAATDDIFFSRCGFRCR